jgi:hypothetical protein
VCWPETTAVLHGDWSTAHHDSCIWQHVEARSLYCIVQYTCTVHCYGIWPQLGCLGLTSQNTAAIRQVPPRLHGYTRCCPQTHDEKEFQHAAPRNVLSSSSSPSSTRHTVQLQAALRHTCCIVGEIQQLSLWLLQEPPLPAPTSSADPAPAEEPACRPSLLLLSHGSGIA